MTRLEQAGSLDRVVYFKGKPSILRDDVVPSVKKYESLPTPIFISPVQAPRTKGHVRLAHTFIIYKTPADASLVVKHVLNKESTFLGVEADTLNNADAHVLRLFRAAMAEDSQRVETVGEVLDDTGHLEWNKAAAEVSQLTGLFNAEFEEMKVKDVAASAAEHDVNALEKDVGEVAEQLEEVMEGVTGKLEEIAEHIADYGKQTELHT